MSERVSGVLLLLGLSILLGACGEGSAADGVLQIAVVPKGTTHEFWKSVHAGAESAAADLGVEILWKGPLREDDRDEQIKVLEGQIARGVDGIVLAPLDEVALVSVAREAAAEGIPLVVFDSDLDWDGRVSYVATDNYAGGVLAARELGRLLDGTGTAIALRYVEGSSSTMRREAGFLETLAEEFPGIEVVSSNQHTGATPDGAFNTAENLLVSHPDVDGVFCPCEPVVFGMLRALEDAGRAGDIRVVGFDATEKLLDGLRAGTIDALVVQNPFAMGELAVRALVDHLQGRAVEKRIDTGVVVVTAANLDQVEIQALLSPDPGGLED
jgi:ribose transport system substrate-binding protein